ncbi:MAG: hypothetical protein EHM18_00170 [Acidobacteria bacterium]|nr:MAG: hypothetical protein EHM18_00170 [Acidobacteriota bacterium]
MTAEGRLLEHYYRFFDAAKVGPVLELSWNEFFQRGYSTATPICYLLPFALDNPQLDEDDEEAVDAILDTKTVRWTMERSSPQFHFLEEILDSSRLPSAGVFGFSPVEADVLVWTAAESFLNGLIDSQMLWSVFKLHSVTSPSEYFQDLPPDKDAILRAAVPIKKLWDPIFRWQGKKACRDMDWDNCLGPEDTRHFFRFIRKAWRKNWPAKCVGSQATRYVKVKPDSTPSFRDFYLCQELYRVASTRRFREPCVYRRWE